MLNVACFVQSRLTDADFVIFSNYCLIGTRRKPCFSRINLRLKEGPNSRIHLQALSMASRKSLWSVKISCL